MSLHSSWYSSPENLEEEIRIWQDAIASPDDLPQAEDDAIALEEEESLSSTDYQDSQARIDEDADTIPKITLSQPTRELIERVSDLSAENLDLLIQIVLEMLDDKDAPSTDGDTCVE